MHQIELAGYQDVPARDLEGMYRLRYATFKERLSWQVETEEGMERDRFDGPETTYIYAKSDQATIDACWRLLPTTGPYMLESVFPELLHGAAPPCDARVWELSRFAVATSRTGGTTAAFGSLSVELMAESVRFARRSGIDRYVTVTSVAVERLLNRQGVNIHRIGPPIRIGVTLTVACFIEIDGITARALGVDAAALLS